MAEVLRPVSSPNNMTLSYSQDAFQPSNTPNLTASKRQFPRHSMYNMPTNNMTYRAHSSAPVAPYAFQSPPSPRNKQPLIPPNPSNTANRVGFRAPYHDSSASSVSSASSLSNHSSQKRHGATTKDDSVIATRNLTPYADYRFSQNYSASLSTPDLALTSMDAKSSPDRYRRLVKSPEQHQLRPMSASFLSHDQRSFSDNFEASRRASLGGRTGSFDDSNISLNASRYKRRSIGRIDSYHTAQPVSSPVNAFPSKLQKQTNRQSMPSSGFQVQPIFKPHKLKHGRSSSQGDARSPASSSSKLKPTRNSFGSTSSPLANDKSVTPMTAFDRLPSKANQNIQTQRPATANPSGRSSNSSHKIEALPISRPQTSDPKLGSKLSPAVQQLSAVSEKNSPNTMKSRIRRAFSFSSSSELRKASAENNMAAERAKARQERSESELDDTDVTIAAQQEASGLGNNIYTHQGEIAASTDNISISSTASSASIMLRKMGRGVKKSTRNLRNLFRPKSMIDGDKPVTNSRDNSAPATVSLVTVEAERERVNVNVDPHEKPGGGTGFPRLEQNSLDRSGSPTNSVGEISSRKSIVGGDKERSEVLAAVRKGILKRTPTSLSSSPVIMQADSDAGASVDGSGPSTPIDGSIRNEYFPGFSVAAQYSTRSLPVRNISFNNKVTFFDVWSANEYDRRGEIATCNRLTPMLAQQIKEELNSFKMEMEVHEDSKPHTHFF